MPFFSTLLPTPAYIFSDILRHYIEHVIQTLFVCLCGYTCQSVEMFISLHIPGHRSRLQADGLPITNWMMFIQEQLMVGQLSPAAVSCVH